MTATLDHVFRWWATDAPDRLALVHGDDRISYAELDQWVGRVASRLLALGVRPGDRVCIFAANGIPWCVAALATIRAGAILSGLNNRMVAAEVSYLLGDYAPTVLVVDPEGKRLVAETAELAARDGAPVAPPTLLRIAEIDALRTGAVEQVRVERSTDDPVVIVTTSGSTARPKGVVYSHRAMIDHAAAWAIEDPVGYEGPRILIVAPMSTSAGCVQFAFSLVNGGTCFLVERFEPGLALELVAREKISLLCGAPIFFQRMADHPAFASTDISSLRITNTGGAPVAIKLLQAWADRGVFLRQMYGQSECGGYATVNSRRHALSHPDKCGSGGALREIAIIDADGNRLPNGTEGQIVVRCPGIMLGYWNNPEASAEVLVDGWLRTGDIGVIDELGLLKMIDRAKDIIISGGLNISAAEIERVIMDVPGVEEVAVIAAADEAFGETPFAIVHGPSAAIPAIVEHCNSHLSAFKVPRYVVVQERPLPRLATGKISKPALRSAYPSPSTTLERVR